MVLGRVGSILKRQQAEPHSKRFATPPPGRACCLPYRFLKGTMSKIAVSALVDEHRAQLMNYLRTGLKVVPFSVFRWL